MWAPLVPIKSEFLLFLKALQEILTCKQDWEIIATEDTKAQGIYNLVGLK